MNLLLTGASGYIGGTLLNRLISDFPTIKIFALVRTDSQATAITGLGCVPVRAALDDAEALTACVVDNLVTIVVHAADAIRFAPAEAMMDGLAAVKLATGKRVHFFFVRIVFPLFSSIAKTAGIRPREPSFSPVMSDSRKISPSLTSTAPRSIKFKNQRKKSDIR